MSIRNLPLMPRLVNHTKIPNQAHNSETGDSSTMPTNRFGLNFPKLSPRPGIVSMLNNKGVIYMERRQYDKAKKSLSRALQMVAKERTSESVARAVVANGKPVTSDPLPLLPSSRPKHGDYKTKRCPIQSEIVTITSLPSSLPSTEADRSKKAFHHRSEYDEGMDYFKTPLRLEDSSRSVNGTILFNLGRVSHNQGNYKDALDLYQRSLEALASWPTSDEPLKLAILFGIAQLEYISGNHSESFTTYETSMSLARSAFGEESIEVAACLNCIGVLHYAMPGGDKDSALEALQKSLSLQISIRGEEHIDVGTTWNNVGRVYFQQMLYDEALEAYSEALRIRQACQGESVDCAAVYFNIGQVHHQLGQQSEALRHYRDFLRLAKVFFGDYHRDICIVVTSIGQVFHERKEYKRALKAFHHALKIGRVALGPHHAEIAITLNKLGNLHYEAGDLEAALKVYHQGLEVELAVLEPGDPNIFVTYTNIAEIHKHRAEYDKAVEHYQNVVNLQRKYGHDDVDIANTLSSIGYVRHQQGDFSGALEVNQECLRLRREAKGEMNEEVAAALTHIAIVLLKMDMSEMALEVLEEAYRIHKGLNNVGRDLAFTLYQIGLIHHTAGDHDLALVYYLETARVEKTALGKAHRDLSITYYNLAQIYFHRGDMELALANFHEALSIERECFGNDHPTCARTLNEMANIELQIGNTKEMMEYYTEALRIYKGARLGEDHLVIYGQALWRFDLVHPLAAATA